MRSMSALQKFTREITRFPYVMGNSVKVEDALKAYKLREEEGASWIEIAREIGCPTEKAKGITRAGEVHFKRRADCVKSGDVYIQDAFETKEEKDSFSILVRYVPNWLIFGRWTARRWVKFLRSGAVVLDGELKPIHLYNVATAINRKSGRKLVRKMYYSIRSGGGMSILPGSVVDVDGGVPGTKYYQSSLEYRHAAMALESKGMDLSVIPGGIQALTEAVTEEDLERAVATILERKATAFLERQVSEQVARQGGARIREAEDRMCVCESSPDHVYVGTIRLEDERHELESLDQFYCAGCNSTWKEA
jgi:hypothetical protein